LRGSSARAATGIIIHAASAATVTLFITASSVGSLDDGLPGRLPQQRRAFAGIQTRKEEEV
jgi:hypothetical protein